MGHSSWLEWPWLSRRGMLTIKRTCFAACCSFSRLNTAFPHLDILPSSFILHEIEWFWRLEYIFLSLKKVSYCKCWWNFFFFVFTNNRWKTDQLSWMALVEQKRDDDYEEDMFCRLLFIFLSLAQSLRPFVRQVSRSTVTHSLSKMHCIQTIGLAFNGHTH